MAGDGNAPTYAYRWFSRRLMPERRGQRCRIVEWALKTKVGGTYFGAWRGVRVEFEVDGLIVEAERGMIKTRTGYAESAASRLGERVAGSRIHTPEWLAERRGRWVSGGGAYKPQRGGRTRRPA